MRAFWPLWPRVGHGLTMSHTSDVAHLRALWPSGQRGQGKNIAICVRVQHHGARRLSVSTTRLTLGLTGVQKHHLTKCNKAPLREMVGHIGNIGHRRSKCMERMWKRLWPVN
jgi:hypothetical protein